MIDRRQVVCLILILTASGSPAQLTRLQLEDLPDGTLRVQVEQLPPKARERALSALARIPEYKYDLPSLRADSEGDLYYVCGFGLTGKVAEVATLVGPPRRLAGAVPSSEPPVYHSRPGVTNVLYLDFGGHVVTNTRWNTDKGVARWDCGPFDADGDTTTFSPTELSHIRHIWERVSEDFAAFDVDVTTEQPPAWHSRVAHALITPAYDMNGVPTPLFDISYIGTILGIAYMNAFTNALGSYDQNRCLSPAWIRPSAGSAYSATADTISHELGHNLGLSHDGITSPVTEYCAGFDATTNSPSWAPIMGSGSGRDVTQFSKGEYYRASRTTQDDFAVLSSRLSYLPDDVGNSNSAATVLGVTNGAFCFQGLLGGSNDLEAFRLTTGPGTLHLVASPFRSTNGTWGGNSDLVLLLMQSNGTVIASNNPAADIRAVLTRVVTGGTYYARVYPTGAGTPSAATPSGYTAYGCVGGYSLTGQVALAGGGLELVYPLGNQALFQSSGLDIGWRCGFTNPVHLELWRSGAVHLVMATNLPNQGTYSWTIPSGLPTGPGYQLRVVRADQPATMDEAPGEFAVYASPQLFFENFEAGPFPPTGWSQEILGGTNLWRVQSGGRAGGQYPPAAASGSNNATLFYGRSTNRLVTSSFNLAGAQEVTLAFQLALYASDYIEFDELRVRYRTSVAAPWQTIFANTNRWYPDWEGLTFALTNLSSDFSLCFEGETKWGHGICLDDIRLTGYLPLPILLEVTSPHGAPDPAVGTNTPAGFSTIQATPGASPLEVGGTQLVCVGWTGAGNIPASGSGTSVTFQLIVPSTLFWRWETNLALDATAGTGGRLTGATNGWYPLGSLVTVTAVPDAYMEFAGWGGLAEGDTNQAVLGVAITQPRQLLANFRPRLAAQGTPWSWLVGHYPETTDFDEAEQSDTDGDGFLAWQEYLCRTEPTNRNSALRFLAGPVGDDEHFTFVWDAVSGRYYSLHLLTNLLGSEEIPVFEDLPADATGPRSVTNPPPPDAPATIIFRLRVAP